MKIVPLFKVRDIKGAVAFYTGVLDFELIYAEDIEMGVIDLIKDGAELQLTIYESDKLFGSVANVWVDDVDGLFEKYLERGLDTSHKKESPVHQGPLDQSWGTREFYITDNDGNTLRFCKRLS
jgi:catechol 2,3-dioxygenase-like lactoylglutathione lyase family enzyme